MIAVDAAHWWGPAGWLYRNTPGNLTSSAIAFTAGFTVGYVKKLRPHFEKVHSRIDELHDKHDLLHRKIDGT